MALSLRKMPIEDRRAYFREAAQRCYARNREAILERQRARYAANIEAKRAYHREYMAQRKADGLASPRRKWSEADRANRRRWYAADPTVVRAQEQKRRALKMGSGGKGVTRKEWAEILDEFGGRCAYCARPQSALSMEHIDPIAAGGSHEPENVVPACKSCNSSKGPKPLLLWLLLSTHLQKAG